MENITILLKMADMEYGRALQKALSANNRHFIVRLADISSDISSSYGEDKAACDCDMILTEQLSDSSEKGKEPVSCKKGKGDSSIENRQEDCPVPEMLLVEKAADDDWRKARFYKYGNVREICAHLLFAYTAHTGRKLTGVSSGLTIYDVFSSSGGCGCTSVALALAQEMKKYRDQKVFFISLEQFDTADAYFQTRKDCRDIGEYIYYMSTGKKESCSAIEEFTITDACGIEKMPAANGINPLVREGSGRFDEFLEAIAGTSRYDAVIIDSGPNICEVTARAFAVSDAACHVFRTGSRCRRQYMDHLRIMSGTDNETPVIEVENRITAVSTQEAAPDTAVRISEDPDSFMEDEAGEYISLAGSFGKSIRGLADRITEAL